MSGPPAKVASGFPTVTVGRFRRAMRSHASGVVVVTAAHPTGPAGITVTSFVSQSLDPPLISWSLGKDSTRHDLFHDAELFAIHVLKEGQGSLAHGFAVHRWAKELLPPTAFNPWGVPVLPDVAARIDCRRENMFACGDHWIIAGRVMEALEFGKPPLVYCASTYGAFRANDSQNTK